MLFSHRFCESDRFLGSEFFFDQFEFGFCCVFCGSGFCFYVTRIVLGDSVLVGFLCFLLFVFLFVKSSDVYSGLYYSLIEVWCGGVMLDEFFLVIELCPRVVHFFVNQVRLVEGLCGVVSGLELR